MILVIRQFWKSVLLSQWSIFITIIQRRKWNSRKLDDWSNITHPGTMDPTKVLWLQPKSAGSRFCLHLQFLKLYNVRQNWSMVFEVKIVITLWGEVENTKKTQRGFSGLVIICILIWVHFVKIHQTMCFVYFSVYVNKSLLKTNVLNLYSFCSKNASLSTIHQRFSNFRMHQNRLEGLLKFRLPGTNHPQNFWVRKF